MGKTSVLGKFESDYDWAQDDGRSRNAKQRFHSQTYVNGSECDLTGRPRSAEVRVSRGRVPAVSSLAETTKLDRVVWIICFHSLPEIIDF